VNTISISARVDRPAHAQQRQLRSSFDRFLYRVHAWGTTLCGTLPAGWLIARGLVTTLDLVLLAVFYALTLLGWSLGWHRMLAHRAFDAHPALKAVLLGCAGMAFQGKPSAFVWIHRMHHRHADKALDPHSPRDGLFHAHMGWFLDYEPPPHELDRNLRDGVERFFERHWVLFTCVGGVLPFLLGGFLAEPPGFSWWHACTGLIWGGFTRLFLANNAMWLGGSLGHSLGHRTFHTNDDSRNSVLLALVMLGDGWHNNHHAEPRAANQNARPWHLDLCAALLKVCAWFGLVKDLHWLDGAAWERRARILEAQRAASPPKTPPAPLRVRRELSERVAIGLVLLLPFVGSFYALAHVLSGKPFVLELLTLAVWHLVAYTGMTLGYHRMLCHRAFSAHPVLKGLLLYCGGLACLASPSEFVAQHLAHHAHSDKERDPHSTYYGFWHAHLGWILRSDKLALQPPRRIAADAMVRFFDRAHALVALSGVVLPALCAGVIGHLLDHGRFGFSSERAFAGMLFGGALRLFLGQHLVFASASFNHSFGSRTFETPDRSHNSPWLLNVLQLGEGYHNHHHANPSAASFAVRPGQIDVNAALIRVFEALGLVREVRWQRPEDWQRFRPSNEPAPPLHQRDFRLT
jgi:stearoyl-CoA desaturase (Delta-9 desaturase)